SAAEELAQEALRAAQQAVASLNSPGGGNEKQSSNGDAGQPMGLPAFTASASNGAAGAEGIDLLSDVNLNVTIELGRTHMYVEDVLRLKEGAVVELDKLAGDPVDVYVNNRHVARGEVLIVNDNFCVRINEILAGTATAPPEKKVKA
ncbi:MAG: flagellar motor switch protein FliN, partial [Planctomycetota bacterium]|nr:flagellar motor switch protein FliN [Planctomycetota bacterium]